MTATTNRLQVRKPSRTPKLGQGPVRVSFVIDSLSRAGTESQLLALLRTLDHQVIAPTLVLLNGTGEESRSLEPENCPVVRLGVRKLFGVGALTAAGKLRKLWRQEKPDIVQAYFQDSAYFSLPIARWSGVPKLLRVRNNLGYWMTRRHRILGAMVSPLVHKTITNTDAGRQQLVQVEGFDPESVVVIENGVDLDRFPRAMNHLPFLSPTITVGCVANLRPVKNIDGLMRAAAKLLKRIPELKFVIAGDGESRPQLEQLHSELGLGERFQFLGSVTDIPEFLSTIDIAVLPSHSEGMSNALLEYLAAGRAVVATDVGANSKIIQNGEQGLIIPPADEDALARAIERFVTEPYLARKLAHAGRVHVEKHYSREAMRKEFEQFYLKLAGRL